MAVFAGLDAFNHAIDTTSVRCMPIRYSIRRPGILPSSGLQHIFRRKFVRSSFPSSLHPIPALKQVGGSRRKRVCWNGDPVLGVRQGWCLKVRNGYRGVLFQCLCCEDADWQHFSRATRLVPSIFQPLKPVIPCRYSTVPEFAPSMLCSLRVFRPSCSPFLLVVAVCSPHIVICCAILSRLIAGFGRGFREDSSCDASR